MYHGNVSLLMSMKFIVRYWSSLFPEGYRESDGAPRWVDYSLHPASKLGLHNALLAVHDRLEILRAHGGAFECAVFVVEGTQCEKLVPESANALFLSLPRGEVKWLAIRDFLLPVLASESSLPAAGAETVQSEQLTLFEHVQTLYDQLESKPSLLDTEA